MQTRRGVPQKMESWPPFPLMPVADPPFLCGAIPDCHSMWLKITRSRQSSRRGIVVGHNAQVPGRGGESNGLRLDREVRSVDCHALCFLTTRMTHRDPQLFQQSIGGWIDINGYC